MNEKELQKKAIQVRRGIIEAVHGAGAGASRRITFFGRHIDLLIC